jgi:hypothetical protein
MLIHTTYHGYCFLRYFAGKVVPIITTFISGQRKIQENYFPAVFNIGFLLICGLGYARLTGARYAQFIGTELPDLLEIVPLAPPHFSRNVREMLDKQYAQRWIGRGGPHHWPARSPDLNLNHLKSIIYRRPINSEADLRVRIQEAFVSVTE